MNKNFLLVAFFSFFIGVASADQYPVLDPQQQAQYSKQLSDAIARAEQSVKDNERNATRTDISPNWNSKLELQNAVIQLEVKKTLVNNFKGTDSLRSAAVRQKLLNVLNKSVITTADLADLQSLVIDEKAKIRAEQQQNDAQQMHQVNQQQVQEQQNQQVIDQQLIKEPLNVPN